MRELLILRDHARQMFESCDDERQARLWEQIADEIDAYIEHGDEVPEMEPLPW